MKWVRKKIRLVTLLAILGAGLVVVMIFSSSGAPWTPKGTLVVVTRAVPVLDDTTGVTAFGFGIDDIVLQREDGDTDRISIFTRRILFDLRQMALNTLLDTRVPTGTYTTLDMRLTSPELRNDQSEGTAPGQVSLPFEHITLPITYRVEENVTTVILIGFETLQAIHDNKYLPVLQVETRTGSSIRTNESGQIYVDGGVIVNNATYGMDWSGAMHQNFRAQDTTTTIIPSVVEVSDNLEQSFQEDTKTEKEGTATTTSTASTTISTEDVNATTSDVSE